MENASKALIIAGAILIAIMVISLGYLIFSRMGGSAKEMANMDEQEIAAFNSKITPYLGGAVSGSQVNALVQYCLSVNMSAKNSGETYKQITIKNNRNATSLNPTDTTYTRVETNGKYYTVKVEEYSKEGLIHKLSIKQN